MTEPRVTAYEQTIAAYPPPPSTVGVSGTTVVLTSATTQGGTRWLAERIDEARRRGLEVCHVSHFVSTAPGVWPCVLVICGPLTRARPLRRADDADEFGEED